MNNYLTITEQDLKRFAPRAKKEYVAAFVSGLYDLRVAGVLDNEFRLCHFMAQVGHETGGLTVVRESLHYTSAKRLRQVWPSRFRAKTDAELSPLLNNGLALGDVVYGGRMGNTHPGDGWNYRGGGPLQSTGRAAVTKYAEELNVEPVPALLDDPHVTLKFACLEWAQSGCNALADQNDLTLVSKAINVGSATSTVKPVDMTGRQAWFAKAWSVWGDKRPADKPMLPEHVTSAALKIGGGTLAAAETTRQVVPMLPQVPEAVTSTVTNAAGWQSAFKMVAGLSSEFLAVGAGGITIVAGLVLLDKWRNR